MAVSRGSGRNLRQFELFLPSPHKTPLHQSLPRSLRRQKYSANLQIDPRRMLLEVHGVLPPQIRCLVIRAGANNRADRAQHPRIPGVLPPLRHPFWSQKYHLTYAGSCKKELLSKILVRLKDFLIHKLQNCYEAEALYLKRSQEEARNSSEHATDKNAVAEVINKVVALGYRNEKGKERMLPASSPKKNQAKPKVRYFSLQADQFRLELASSSFTGISFRPSVPPTALLNHILYSRLPDVLQSSRARQHLVLTLNPIVDLY